MFILSMLFCFHVTNPRSINCIVLRTVLFCSLLSEIMSVRLLLQA